MAFPLVRGKCALFSVELQCLLRLVGPGGRGGGVGPYLYTWVAFKIRVSAQLLQFTLIGLAGLFSCLCDKA